MPSPFPGMDPHLEHPALWPGVHQRIAWHGSENLQDQLAKGYYVEIGERVYIEPPDLERSIYPDAFVVKTQTLTRSKGPGTTLVADEPVLLLLEAVERKEVFLELRAAHEGHRVVCVIEILSPANKHAGPGRELYLKKQAEVLGSSSHLVEIDLLRSGTRTVAAPAHLLGDESYRVVVSRAGDRLRRELYPFTVRQRLPRVSIPIDARHPDIVLDLPAVMAQVYDKGHYGDRLDYAREPVPPLDASDSAWFRETRAIT